MSSDSKEGHVACFKYHMKFVLRVKLPLPSSQMMDFVFFLPEGQESGQFCIYRSAWPFPPSSPAALSMSYARNQWVWCSDLHGVRHNSGSLCVLISLNKWKVKCLKAGQLWAVPEHQCWLFVFLDFNKGVFARRPWPSCSYNTPTPTPGYKNT